MKYICMAMNHASGVSKGGVWRSQHAVYLVYGAENVFSLQCEENLLIHTTYFSSFLFITIIGSNYDLSMKKKQINQSSFFQ